jgi:hypothetical protein
LFEDFLGEMDIVNSKSEEEDDENECDGDEGSVYDLDSFTLLLLFPISSLFFSTTSYIAAYATLCIYYGWHGFMPKLGEATQLYHL